MSFGFLNRKTSLEQRDFIGWWLSGILFGVIIRRVWGIRGFGITYKRITAQLLKTSQDLHVHFPPSVLIKG
jgi:hypothetical protein